MLATPGRSRLRTQKWNICSKIFIYALILMFDPSKCSSHKTALIYELKQAIIKGKSGEKLQKHIWDFQKILVPTSKWHIYHVNEKNVTPKMVKY